MRPSVSQSVTHSQQRAFIPLPHTRHSDKKTPPLPILLSPRNRPRGEAGSFKSIWYLLQEPVPNYFQLPRFVLPTVLAPSQDFVRPTKDHRHTTHLMLCPCLQPYVTGWANGGLGESPSPRRAFFTLSFNWPGPEVRGTSLETDVRRLVQERLLAEHCRWRPWPSFCLPTCFFILMLCCDLFFFFACDSSKIDFLSPPLLPLQALSSLPSNSLITCQLSCE